MDPQAAQASLTSPFVMSLICNDSHPPGCPRHPSASAPSHCCASQRPVRGLWWLQNLGTPTSLKATPARDHIHHAWESHDHQSHEGNHEETYSLSSGTLYNESASRVCQPVMEMHLPRGTMDTRSTRSRRGFSPCRSLFRRRTVATRALPTS